MRLFVIVVFVVLGHGGRGTRTEGGPLDLAGGLDDLVDQLGHARLRRIPAHVGEQEIDLRKPVVVTRGERKGAFAGLDELLGRGEIK